MLKCEWKFYKDSGLLSDDSERVIEDLLKLPDWELVKRFEEAHYMISPTEYRNKFQEKFRTEVERKNPSISQIVSDHLAKMKPTLQGRYNGENCLVYSTENIEPPLVYFPEAAREYLPDAFGFYGRITGIVNYVANPPLKGAPSLILRATVLSLPLA
jgi:hypothetical protein